jgi:hypothetical protein|tara:strand:- start:144 stop:347 length:204 start_codon:yes stop_codon:yes gene_type:complete
MARLSRFENYRFIGNRLNMKVYDCDNLEEFKSIEILFKEKEMLMNNKVQSFSPDSLEEAINRGYKAL